MLFDHRYRDLLHDGLVRSASRCPEKIAVHAGAESMSYGELHARSDRLAAALLARGLERGDRVAIFMDNSLPCVVSIFGILKAGGVFVVVNPQTKHDKLRFIANDCAVRHLVTDIHLAGVGAAVVGTVPSLTHILVSGSTGDLEPLRGPDVKTERLDEVLEEPSRRMKPPGTIPSDLASLIYTSGSTGNPKGVMQTHQSMVFAVGSLIEYQRLEADEVLINMLPLAFDYGLYQVLMSVAMGASLVLERSFTFAAEVFARILEHGVTHFPGVPTIYAMMIAAHRRKPLEFPAVRRLTNTAAALHPALIPTLREIFPNAMIFPMYGLTECKRASYLPPELVDAKPGSVGIAIPGTEVYLRSPEGRPVAPGEPGILHVRGPHVMRGYWNSPERTAKMLKPGDAPGESVLCTGDWFRMDGDGFLYFLHRSDDIIKTRGEKVSPAEVEAALCAVPGVAEAAAIGVPDELLGHAVWALVVASPGAKLEVHGLRQEMAQRLENFMVPQNIILRESLPRSPNGKIDRQALEQLVAAEERTA